MQTFIYILVNIIFPIFAIALAGYVAQKKLNMDSRTFSKINIYIFVPAVIFIKIYEAKISLGLFGTILAYIISIQLVMFITGMGIARLMRYPKGMRNALTNSLQFFNSGNYGLPLVELLYRNNPMATIGQVFIMLIQNMTVNTIGVFQASASKTSHRKALKNVLTMPSMYVIAVVIFVKVFSITVPSPVLIPLKYISNGFIGFALLTLGVQLAEIKVRVKLTHIMVSSVIRLLISPLLGFFIVRIMGIEGVLAQSLIIGVATPVAVNTAIIAREFDNEPDYAAQAVFVSTVLSPVTISIIICLYGLHR